MYFEVPGVMRDFFQISHQLFFHMLKEYDEKEIAVGLYRQGKVSLAKAAGIAGVSMTRMD